MCTAAAAAPETTKTAAKPTKAAVKSAKAAAKPGQAEAKPAKAAAHAKEAGEATPASANGKARTKRVKATPPAAAAAAPAAKKSEVLAWTCCADTICMPGGPSADMAEGPEVLQYSQQQCVCTGLQ